MSPEITVVKLTDGNGLDDLMDILKRHPLHCVVSHLKVSVY